MGEVDRIPFTLNYNKLTERNLFRKGCLRDPFPDELRCTTHEEYAEVYESNMTDREGPRRLKDFILDESGEIRLDIEGRGISVFTTDEQLIETFYRKKPKRSLGKHWLLRENTPIPKEIEVEGPNESGHVLIRPAVNVKPEIFKQMLGCLYWVKAN